MLKLKFFSGCFSSFSDRRQGRVGHSYIKELNSQRLSWGFFIEMILYSSICPEPHLPPPFGKLPSETEQPERWHIPSAKAGAMLQRNPSLRATKPSTFSRLLQAIHNPQTRHHKGLCFLALCRLETLPFILLNPSIIRNALLHNAENSIAAGAYDFIGDTGLPGYVTNVQGIDRGNSIPPQSLEKRTKWSGASSVSLREGLEFQVCGI